MTHRLTYSEARRIRYHEATLQKEWLGRKNVAERFGEPFDEPYPEFTIPVPFSREFEKRFIPDPKPSMEWVYRGLGAASYGC